MGTSGQASDDKVRLDADGVATCRTWAMTRSVAPARRVLQGSMTLMLWLECGMSLELSTRRLLRKQRVWIMGCSLCNGDHGGSARERPRLTWWTLTTCMRPCLVLPSDGGGGRHSSAVDDCNALLLSSNVCYVESTSQQQSKCPRLW